MAMISNFLSLAFVYLVTVLSSGCAEECVKRSPCICVYPNGTGIDLTPASQGKFYSTLYFEQELKSNASEIKLSTYYFHPCGDLPTNHTDVPDVDSCQRSLSVYRNVTVMKSTDLTTQSYKINRTVCNYLGDTTAFLFSPNDLGIIFRNGPSNTTIFLKCADDPGQLVVSSLKDEIDLKLTFLSRDACLKQIEEPGRSFGSTLLIIFFSFVIFYLVLGVCTKKFLMGATGIEVIPNLGFWTDLPNLVRDGWAFAVSGFKLPARGSPAGPADPNSYDSI